MSNLKVTYQILLVEDISKKSGAVARALESAGQRQVKALQQTDKAAVQAGKAVADVGKNTGLSKIGSYAGNAQSSLNNVAVAAQRADASIARIGGGQSSFARMNNYLLNIGKNLDAARQKAAQFGAAVGKADGVVTGAAAGGAAAAAMLKRPMDFDRRLGEMANTAFAERDTKGRIAGIGELEGAINNAVRQYGGTRDSAAAALDTVIASGAVSVQDAIKMLPGLQQAATASGAAISELSNIAIRSMQNFGLKADEIPVALSKAIRAGQEGGFELKDMSRWLPQMMAVSKGMLGMEGMAGLEKLLAMSQASAITAGTKDEAGNNLINLLNKVNSRDTAMDFEKLGFNLPKSLKKAMEDGHAAPDAFVNFVEQIAMTDKDFASLKKKAEAASGDEKKKVLEQMAAIMQGSAIGQVIQDRQAVLALIALMQNKDYMKKVEKSVAEEKTQATEGNMALMQTRASFKAQQTAAEADIARSNVFRQIEGPLNSILTSVTGLAREFPALTTTVVAAAGAWGIFKAAMVGRGLMQLLQGGGAAGMAGMGAGGLPGMMSTVPMGGIPAGGAGSLLRNPMALRTLGILAGGVVAYNTLSDLNDNKLTEMQKAESAGSAIGMVSGGVLGALFGPAGAMAGSTIGGWVGKNALTGGGMYDEGMTHPDMMDFSYLASPHRQAPGPEAMDTAAEKLAAWVPPAIEIGKGAVDFHIFMHDERTDVTTNIREQPQNLTLDPGSTNPGGR